MTDSDLLQRLSAIRATARRRLVLYGIAVTTGAGLLALILLVLLDWWLWLPSGIRCVNVAAFLLGGVVMLVRWIVRPLRAPFSLTQIAGRLERRFPELGDRLTSTVSFLRATGPPEVPAAHLGSPSMIRRMLDNTERLADRISLEEGLTRRPLIRCAGACVAVVMVTAVIVAGAPGWFRTGITRYARPFGEEAWPRTVEIESLQRDTKVALGDSLLVRMRVSRGMGPNLRGTVHVRDAADRTTTFAMEREAAADFYCTIERIVDDLSYWFAAGDATTEATPCRVTVVRPPSVVEAAARVTAPPYVGPRPDEEFDLGSGDIQAVRGSTVTIFVRASGPVGLGDDRRPLARLEFTQGPPVPLHIEDGDPTRLTGSLELVESGELRVVLEDADGFRNASDRTFRLRATADQPPVVTLVEPTAHLAVTAQGSVALLARVSDDFGIRQIRLTGKCLNRNEPIDIPLADVASNGSPVTEVRYTWDLSPLELVPGDTIVYHASVTDNYGFRGASGQSTDSPPLRLNVIEAREFEDRLRDEFALLQKHVRRALLDQEAVLDDSRALGERMTPLANALADGAAPPRAERARQIGGRQNRLTDRLGRLAARFDRVRGQAQRNRAFDEQTRKQIADITRQLAETAVGTAGRAARALDRLADAPPSTDPEATLFQQRARLEESVSAQEATSGELRQVLRWMARWGDFQEMVARTRDLLDRQQRIRAEARQRNRGTIGRSADALEGPARARLHRLVREQEQLARDLEQWVGKGRTLVRYLKTRKDASAAALEEAVRAAVAHRVRPHVTRAVEALRENRTAAAGIEQRAVETALSKALTALEDRQLRDLARLRKSVERARDALAEQLRRQADLLAATEEAVRLDSHREAHAALADEQRSVRRNVSQLRNQIADTAALAKAAGPLGQALPPMERSEDRLRSAAAELAVPGQREAIAALESALEVLEAIAAQTEHRLMQKTLAQNRRELEAIRDRQTDINTASSELVAGMAGRRRPGRVQARRASRLAHRQADVHGDTTALTGRFEGAAVYAWVLERVAQRMSRSQNSLTARRLDTALTENQAVIVRDLGRLIEAVKSIETLSPPDRFTDGDGGGGGGGGISSKQPPVPPVAELMVIRAMQAALNDNTAALHTEMADDEPTETQLRRAREMGEEQQALRLLTERLTRKARTGDGS